MSQSDRDILLVRKLAKELFPYPIYFDQANPPRLIGAKKATELILAALAKRDEERIQAVMKLPSFWAGNGWQVQCVVRGDVLKVLETHAKE